MKRKRAGGARGGGWGVGGGEEGLEWTGDIPKLLTSAGAHRKFTARRLKLRPNVLADYFPLPFEM